MKQSSRQKALSAFQRLRVFQEANGEYVRCISCNKIIHVSEADGGHFENRRNRVTELLPENVHAQCRNCNRFHEGNVIAYRAGIAHKYGVPYLERLENIILASKGNIEAFDKLESKDKLIVAKRKTNQEYEELAKYYRAELRRIKREID